VNLSRLPSGKWRAIFYVDGTRHSLTRDTKGDARRAANQAELDAGKKHGPDELADATVAELVDARIADARWSPTLRADYLCVLERVPDAFLDRRVRAVDVPTVKALYRQLAADGLSAHRVRRIHDLLSQSFKMGVEDEWLRTNPVAGVRRPAITASDVHPPPPADVARLVDAAPDDLQLFLRLAASTGARRGEVYPMGYRRGGHPSEPVVHADVRCRRRRHEDGGEGSPVVGVGPADDGGAAGAPGIDGRDGASARFAVARMGVFA
jgi:hypothetical protein